ncbi:NAD-dependent epimerase/dehydratase family protein [Gracilibacillus salinarum]|uniref:NAD-dependent epimerase/dehydratase family protein n=1 Tax=Gracilibacillus salinarum TaxID=2932255 RepID=A0ABY4GS94_9BACI|nr:NAD-dependent epimerase/dehydratase family protein [Gracilibacillus salinarum]UOQ87015.1 NAD-dependent epimerase/dehydratase family protein [Gracilibacillus salinarum]
MKKILITGVNSYIGTSFQGWVSQYPDMYSVDFINIRDDQWKENSFSGYDVIFHTAAIVHVKENDTDKYFKVNRDLTVKLAKKAKEEGVRQFIFMSTMGVYGKESGYITEETTPTPKTFYAKSKYEAEKLLFEMNSKNFCIATLRPPIVYGRGCPGNYSRLANMAIKLPLFPDIDNKRSMIYIDNLTEFIRLLIDFKGRGVFFPQNKEFVNTTELVKLIAAYHGKKIKTSNVINWAVSMGLKQSGTFKKVFGSFIYEQQMPGSQGVFMNGNILDYEVVSFKESIKRTEYYIM